MKDKRLLKKPKYKIGDVIVYEERYDKDALVKVYQSEIIESYGLIEKEDTEDRLGWFYITKEIDSSKSDSIYEEDIFYKIK